MQKPLGLGIVSLLIAQILFAQEPSAAPSPPQSVRHRLTLAATQENKQHVALIDERVFTTPEGLKRYLRSLQQGDQIIFSRFRDSAEDNPFVSTLQSIRQLCEEKHITFSEIIYD